MLISLALELSDKMNREEKLDIDGIFERVVFSQQERCVEELAESAISKINDRFNFQRSFTIARSEDQMVSPQVATILSKEFSNLG